MTPRSGYRPRPRFAAYNTARLWREAVFPWRPIIAEGAGRKMGQMMRLAMLLHGATDLSESEYVVPTPDWIFDTFEDGKKLPDYATGLRDARYMAAEILLQIGRYDEALAHQEAFERECWGTQVPTFTPWLRAHPVPPSPQRRRQRPVAGVQRGRRLVREGHRRGAALGETADGGAHAAGRGRLPVGCAALCRRGKPAGGGDLRADDGKGHANEEAAAALSNQGTPTEAEGY